MNFNTFNPVKHAAALLGVGAKRLSRSTYYDYYEMIKSRMVNRLGISSRCVNLVVPFGDRQSFGDIDIIVENRALPHDWQAELSRSAFSNAKWARVGETDTYVFSLNGHQVNIHVLRGQTASNIGNYLRYNGVHNILYVYAKTLGLTYIDKGLFVDINSEDRSVLVDSSFTAIANILGINSAEYFNRDQPELHVFQLIYQSRFFNKDKFIQYVDANPDLLAKSPILQRFIDVINNATTRCTTFTLNESTASLIYSMIKTNYPSVWSYLEGINRDHKIASLASSKYNIDIVKNITGLEGEPVEALFKDFQTSIRKDPESFQLYVLSSLPETIKQDLISFRDSQAAKALETPAEQPLAAEVSEAPPLSEVKKPKKRVRKPKSTGTLPKAKYSEDLPPAPTTASDDSFSLAA